MSRNQINVRFAEKNCIGFISKFCVSNQTKFILGQTLDLEQNHHIFKDVLYSWHHSVETFFITRLFVHYYYHVSINVIIIKQG